jgi:hypothetical protein
MTVETRPDFRRFDENGGQFVATWNWLAFIFGPLWYLFHGMWVKALLYFVGGIFLSAVTGGPVGILVWLGFGLLGNYDLYLYRRRGVQLWQPSSFDQPRTAPAMHPPTLADLKALRDQGVLSEEEYLAKRDRMIREAENAPALAAIDRAYRSGVLTDEEFRTKRAKILG